MAEEEKKPVDDGVDIAHPTKEDMAFVRMMRLKVEGKEPISEEVLDLLALFEEELKKTNQGDMAIARAFNRFTAGERVE